MNFYARRASNSTVIHTDRECSHLVHPRGKGEIDQKTEDVARRMIDAGYSWCTYCVTESEAELP